MYKFIMLCMLFLGSTSVLAKNNVLCKGYDSNNSKCVSIANAYFEKRANEITDRTISLQKANGEKGLNRADLLKAVKKIPPFKQFQLEFNRCGENSKNSNAALDCLTKSLQEISAQAYREQASQKK